MAYIGYFRNTDSLFHVLIRKAGDNSTPTEITLAGQQPFVVRYEESETPFDPIRNSTATISIVSPHYFEDVLPSKPYDTEVILYNETSKKIEWQGYLTPKLYSQSYENEIETIELEASDILSSLQYVDYKPHASIRIETFDNIIGNCIEGTLLKGFVWPLTKSTGPDYIYPYDLKISEMNFFSNDTEEPWKCHDVISEMCKYLGFTALQYGEYIYFIDYDILKYNNSYSILFYEKNSSGNWYSSSIQNANYRIDIDKNQIMGNGSSITFEPIYNKIFVKDNFYTCETFIRNIFDDEFLTNRGGSFYSSFEVEAATTPGSYPWGKKWGKQKYVNEEKLDTEYRYFHRLYDHKYYDSIYRTGTLQIANVSDDNRNASHTTKSYVGGTIMDLGRVSKNTLNENLQDIIPNKIDWERYLCICQKGNGMSSINDSNPENKTIFKLKPGTHSEVMLNSKNYIIIDFKAIYEKYQDRNYINPDWTTDTVNMGTTGHQSLRPGNFYFVLGIGGKYWDGRVWREKETDDEVIVFEVEMERPGKFEDKAYINEELSVLNNVSWELNIEEPGYKIPLEGVNTIGEIVFEILLPRLQIITEYDGLPRSLYNGYCWVKDFSIKTTTEGQSIAEEENDVVYENVINESNVNDMDEIDLKFTTAIDGLKPSYSNVIYEYVNDDDVVEIKFLDGFIEKHKTGVYQKPEEHIVERYYNQYSTPTKKITHTLGLESNPFYKYYNVDIDNPNDCYVQLGCEIDYARNKQEITLIQKK